MNFPRKSVGKQGHWGRPAVGERLSASSHSCLTQRKTWISVASRAPSLAPQKDERCAPAPGTSRLGNRCDQVAGAVPPAGAAPVG